MTECSMIDLLEPTRPDNNNQTQTKSDDAGKDVANMEYSDYLFFLEEIEHH